MVKNISIYKTEQYPASAIFQNHIDFVHGLLESYCDENKGYEWGLSLSSRRIIGLKATLNFLSKYEPESLKYFVTHQNNNSELILTIDNGVSINIKNGTHSLYGLFKQLMDACDLMSSPHILVFLRRYWLLNLLIAGMAIPMINYDKFNKRTLSPLASIFGSTKAIISLLASLATIITFFIFLATR